MKLILFYCFAGLLISLSPDPAQLLLIILGVLFVRSLVMYPYLRSRFNVIESKGRSGYIYCFFDLGTIIPAVKIGRETEKGSRLRQHKTAAPLGIVCLYNVKAKDTVYTESYLHSRYAITRFRSNEWFLITPLILFDLILIRLTMR